MKEIMKKHINIEFFDEDELVFLNGGASAAGAGNILKGIKDFQKCREGRQVCYRDIVMEYGKDKWYYPDTKYPYINKN